MVRALDAGAEVQLMPAVGEGLTVLTESGVVRGEGMVDAEPVVTGVCGQSGEFGFQDAVLQPDVGARPAGCRRSAGRAALG
jgi:hypothetical protein